MTAPTYVPPPKPSPGATAWLRSVEVANGPWGQIVNDYAIPWVGFTAAALREHWAKRMTDARTDHRWDVDTLTVNQPAVGRTITRTFHDQDPT